MLQQQLFVESGRVASLRDLTVKMKQSVFRKDLVHVVEVIEKNYSIIMFKDIGREIHRCIFLVLFLSMRPYIILERSLNCNVGRLNNGT